VEITGTCGDTPKYVEREEKDAEEKKMEQLDLWFSQR
jgi:hypothetical protein